MTTVGELQASQDVYVATLPQWVQLWMMWMGVLLFLGSPIFAIFKVEARWALLSMLLTIPATFVVGAAVGWNGLWGITHLIFWTPLVIYMVRRLPNIEVKSIYGVWYVLAIATMTISILLDIKDVGAYLLA